MTVPERTRTGTRIGTGAGDRERHATGAPDHDVHGHGQLAALAGLMRKRAAGDAEISAVIVKIAHLGHIGEFIASRVFDIELHPNAAHPGSDGVFKSRLLWYSLALRPRSSRSGWYAAHSRWQAPLATS